MFSPLSLLQKVTSTSEPTLFSTQDASLFVFIKYFTIFYDLLLNQIINLTSVFNTLFLECFCAIFKNITQVLYKQNRPCKAGWNVYMGKNAPTNWCPGFMNVGYLLGGIIYFHINRFWFFNRIEISLNRDPGFVGIFFLHINRYLPYNWEAYSACSRTSKMESFAKIVIAPSQMFEWVLNTHLCFLWLFRVTMLLWLAVWLTFVRKIR